MSKQRYRDILLGNARQRLNCPSNPLNVGQLSHEDIAWLMYQLCYDSELKGSYLPMIYSESTTPYLFPLGRISLEVAQPKFLESAPDFLFGGMSERHHEMDFFGDCYLVRNSEISGRGRTGLEIQTLASSGAERWLRQCFESGSSCMIFMTGLQPVAVGILVAIERLVMEKRALLANNFRVQFMSLRPEYFSRDRSTAITVDCPGACIEHYQPATYWV